MWFQKPPLGTPLDWGNPLNDETLLALAMSEGNGDVVQDLSLNGNHGKMHNFAFPPTVASGWNPGQTGTGVMFDGADDYINCGNDARLKPANFSVSAIIYAETLGADSFSSYIISNGKDFNNAHGFGLSCGDGTVASWVGNNTLNRKNTIVADINTKTYHTVLATYQEGVGSKLYVGGNLKSSTSAFTGSIVYDTLDIIIGKLSETYYHIDGMIDQPRIMNRVWTAKEARDYAINPWQVYLDE